MAQIFLARAEVHETTRRGAIAAQAPQSKPMTIDVVSYDARWPTWFAALEQRYRAAMQHVPVLAIEHVGSTSVPGLSAKPIIDVDIVVERAAVAAASAALEALGYVPLGELGIPERWAFRAPADGIATNTYVTVAGCLSLRNHLGVRETLQADAELRDEYVAVKQRVASQIDDIEAYTAGRSSTLQTIPTTTTQKTGPHAWRNCNRSWWWTVTPSLPMRTRRRTATSITSSWRVMPVAAASAHACSRTCWRWRANAAWACSTRM